MRLFWLLLALSALQEQQCSKFSADESFVKEPNSSHGGYRFCRRRINRTTRSFPSTTSCHELDKHKKKKKKYQQQQQQESRPFQNQTTQQNSYTPQEV